MLKENYTRWKDDSEEIVTFHKSLNVEHGMMKLISQQYHVMYGWSSWNRKINNNNNQ